MTNVHIMIIINYTHNICEHVTVLFEIKNFTNPVKSYTFSYKGHKFFIKIY